MSAKSCFVIGATAIPVMMLRAPNPFSSLSFPRLTTKTLFSQPTHFRRYSLTATAETVHGGPTSTTQGLDNHHHHPWPEWVAFVDHLKSQGYFSQASSDNVGDATHLLYREMNVLKDPCLSFARDRYDIFSSLPKDDIQIIVEGGCPKLLRKVVNSAKRLRLYVGLNEKKVCSVCSLQGSCDRAYVMLKQSDGDARTVDLMRLLMFYALDPSLVSGAGRTSAIEQAESSSRRLLSMFIDLSKASPGLACVESPETTSNKKKQFASMDVMLPQKIHSQQEKWISNKIPKGVAAKIEKLMRDFLWEDSEEEKRDHLLRWEQVCRPFEEGGVGIGNVASKNTSLLGKWLWRYPREPNSLWHRVIKSKYGSSRNRWDALADANTSSLCPLKAISQVSHLFLPLVKLKVGRGDKILFWEDQ